MYVSEFSPTKLIAGFLAISFLIAQPNPAKLAWAIIFLSVLNLTLHFKDR